MDQQFITQWIIFLVIIYFSKKYIIPFLLISYLIAVVTKNDDNDYSLKHFEETFLYFFAGLIMRPLSVLMDVYNIHGLIK